MAARTWRTIAKARQALLAMSFDRPFGPCRRNLVPGLIVTSPQDRSVIERAQVTGFAILIVTPNYGSNTSGVGPAIGIPAVFYDTANTCGKGADKWVIYNLNGVAQVNNSLFNVMVVLP